MRHGEPKEHHHGHQEHQADRAENAAEHGKVVLGLEGEERQAEHASARHKRSPEHGLRVVLRRDHADHDGHGDRQHRQADYSVRVFAAHLPTADDRKCRKEVEPKAGPHDPVVLLDVVHNNGARDERGD
eukprot:GHVR01052782.1.p3 GENE.GHVR01052782.1~~GHVR01052782.1.p3  ORF type:complete len:129 (-),score=18.10 GHVR01052782.1:20-406(-)